MYLWCLKVTSKQLLEIWKQRKKVIWYLVVSMIILPIVMYYSTELIFSEWSIWVFLLVAAPSWIASIALSSIVKWNTSLVATITILSSLVSVVSIPFLLEVILWSSIDIDVVSILFSLVQWVILPFILAQVTQKIYPSYKKTSHYIWPLTTLFLMPLIFWPIWANIETYKGLGRDILIYGTLWLFLLSIILHFIWRFMYRRSSYADKVWWAIALWYMNITLALLIATEYFWPSAILVILLFEFPWDLMLIPFAWIAKRLK